MVYARRSNTPKPAPRLASSHPTPPAPPRQKNHPPTVSQGKRLGDLADALRGAGLRQVTLKTYPEARHELFNESNRDAVTQDLIDWLEQALRHRRDHSTKERT